MNFKTTDVIDISATMPSLYPNPTKDRLYISGLERSKETGYKVQDVSGRMVQQGIYTSNGIETATLSAGLYVLQTSKGGKVYHLKFTKN